jgi:hypothetical protein
MLSLFTELQLMSARMSQIALARSVIPSKVSSGVLVDAELCARTEVVRFDSEVLALEQ